MELMIRFTSLLIYPWGNSPGTNCIGGWVGPRVDLDVMEKRKITSPYREQNPDSSVVQPVVLSLYRLSYPSF
jgi:hypothetical protein